VRPAPDVTVRPWIADAPPMAIRADLVATLALGGAMDRGRGRRERLKYGS
jgi:hypothetical protein